MNKWCKEARKAMIDKELTISDLATRVKRNRVFVSSIINGRQISRPTIKLISDVLGIRDYYPD